MADGTTKPISEIEVGDYVWAVEPETGEAGERVVTAVWPHDDILVDFTVGAGSVTTTEDHHFWNVTDSEWQETQHIDPGDHLLTAEGLTVEAGNLDWTTAHHADAYDLTVDGLHTYFVGTVIGRVLVHNCGLESLELALKQDGNTGSLILNGPIPSRESVRSLSTADLVQLEEILEISVANRRADQVSGIFDSVDPGHVARFREEESILAMVRDVRGYGMLPEFEAS